MSSGAAVGAIISAASSAAQTAAAAAQSSKQRSFVAEQRRTAFQTQRTDLELAGYNPLLAFQGSRGAESVSYQVPDVSGIGHAGTGFSTYLENKLKNAQFMESRNRSGNLNAQGNLAAALGAKAATEGELISTQTKIAKETLKGAKIEGKIDSSAFGKATRTMKRALDSVNPLTRGIGRRQQGRRR